MKSSKLFLSFLVLSASVRAANITWNTAGPDNNWNTTTANWTGDATTFTAGDNVTFTGAAGETITVAAGGVAPGNFTANHTAGTYAFSGASITGGALTKSGAGILAFNQTNTFSSISASGGPNSATAANAALVFNVSNALGTAPITLSNTGTITAINTNGTSFTVNNPIALTSTASVQTNLLGKTSTTQTYNGLISGGTTTGTLFLNMDASGSNGVTLLANTGNTFTANRITVNRGMLAITGNGSLGAATNTVFLDTTSLNGGLRFDANNINITHPVQFNDYARIDVNGKTGAEISTAISGSAGNRATPYTISGGTLKLSGANTFYHYLEVASGGTLLVTNPTALGTAVGTADRTRVSSGGSLVIQNLTYANAETLELSGTGVSNSGALAATGTSVFNGPISLLANASVKVDTGATLALGGALSGAFELAKTGAGSLTLSGSSLHPGNTRVSEGSVVLSGAMIPTGGFIVSPGASLNLTGLTTPLALNTDATLTAGRSGTAATDVIGSFSTNLGAVRVLEGNAIGTLTLSGNLSVNGGTLHLDLTNNPGGTNDLISVGGTLDLSAPSDISLTPTDGTLGSGSYVLAQAASVTGSVANLSLAGLPPSGTSRQTFSLSTTTVPNALTLDVAGVSAALVWTGATNSNWSTSASDENWHNLTTPDPQDRFFNSDTVTFADLPAPGPVKVDLSGVVSPGQVIINNSTAGSTFTINGGSGNISGVTGLLKQGTGTANLKGFGNDFTGGVQITGGMLVAEFLANSGTACSLGAGSSISFNGGGLMIDDIADNSTNRGITVGAGGGTLAVADSGLSLALTGTVSGNGNLNIGGGGRVVLNGTNNHTGSTSVQSGATLEIAGTTALGTGACTVDGTLAINRSATTTISQGIGGTGSLLKQNTAQLTLPTANTYGGGTSVTNGAILLQNPSALGTGTVSHSGGQVRFSFGDGTASTVANDVSLNSTGHQTFIIRGTADAAATLPTTVSLTGKISGGTAGQTYRLVDSNTAGNHNTVLRLLNAANDFQGSIEIWRGSLGFTSDAALGHPDNDIIHYSENLNGALRFDADNITLGSGRNIDMPGGINARPIHTQAFNATIQGNISGTGILVKQGTGKLVLTGTNSATSATTVAAGTLQVDGTFNTSTGVVTVDAGATLAGTGSVNRPVTVTGSIAPGASVGTLTTGAVTLNGTYACEVNGATSDVIAATDLTLGAASVLNVSNSSGTFPRVIATYSGTLTGTFATVTPGFQVDTTSTPGQILLTEGSAYDTWATSKGLTGPDAAFDADPDNDGISNGLEFVLGGEPNPANPGSNSSALLPTLSLSGGNMVFTYNRTDASAYLNPTVEFNTGLGGSWTTAVDPGNSAISVIDGTPSDTVTVSIPTSGNPHMFARLKVVEEP